MGVVQLLASRSQMGEEIPWQPRAGTKAMSGVSRGGYREGLLWLGVELPTDLSDRLPHPTGSSQIPSDGAEAGSALLPLSCLSSD